METTGKSGVCAVGSVETLAIVLMDRGTDPWENVIKDVTYSEEGTYVAKEQERFWDSSSPTQ